MVNAEAEAAARARVTSIVFIIVRMENLREDVNRVGCWM